MGSRQGHVTSAMLRADEWLSTARMDWVRGDGLDTLDSLALAAYHIERAQKAIRNVRNDRQPQLMLHKGGVA